MPATSKRAPLTRERIARAALELADRDGVEALSMRRLAEELDAGTMTLYGHFRDKQELLGAVLATAFADRERPRLRGSWRNRLRQQVVAARAMLARHPSVVEIWAHQPVVEASALRSVETDLQILADAGFERDEAVKAFRLLITHTVGFTLFSRPRTPAGTRARVELALGQLPADEFPRLVEWAGPFAAASASEESFQYGLERILDGLEARLAEVRR